jgi:flagellar biosynthesis/type III secretory pathway ATPase
MSDIAKPDQIDAVSKGRDALSTYADAADLIQIGAYVPGSDPRVDLAREVAPRMEALIRQKPEEPVSRASALAALRVAVGGRP